MKREVSFAMLVGVVIFGALAYCTGCKPPEVPLPPYCFEEPKFTAALVACASTAPTKEASKTCRAAVHASCGITVTTTDGGTP